jgi:hypothetical protein
MRFQMQVVGSALFFCQVHEQYLQGPSIDLFCSASLLGGKIGKDIHRWCFLSWQGVNNPSALVCVRVCGAGTVIRLHYVPACLSPFQATGRHCTLLPFVRFVYQFVT